MNTATTLVVSLTKNTFTLSARSLVVSDLRLETKGSRFNSGCFLGAEMSPLQ